MSGPLISKPSAAKYWNATIHFKSSKFPPAARCQVRYFYLLQLPMSCLEMSPKHWMDAPPKTDQRLQITTISPPGGKIHIKPPCVLLPPPLAGLRFYSRFPLNSNDVCIGCVLTANRLRDWTAGCRMFVKMYKHKLYSTRTLKWVNPLKCTGENFLVLPHLSVWPT